MKRLITAAVLFAVFPLFAQWASACSLTSCIDNGMELRRDFYVTVKHAGHPLAGVKIQVTKFIDAVEVKQFSGTTDTHGRVHVVGLPAGAYWLKAEFLGIDATYGCFHIASSPSDKAKGKLKYDWGDLAPASRRVAGSLVYCEPANGSNRALNVIRCTPVAVAGARFTLQNPTTGATYSTTSDDSGRFAFAALPSGTYALHIEGGRTPTREYDSTDLLVNVTPDAKWDTLLLTKREAGGGGCGGTSLDLKTGGGQ